MERRLAAILAADVVGYTRLMRADEAGTLQRLTGLREGVLEPLITEHTGRVVKLMGDGLLVEFASHRPRELTISPTSAGVMAWLEERDGSPAR